MITPSDWLGCVSAGSFMGMQDRAFFLHQAECAELEGRPKFHGVVLKTSEGGTHAKAHCQSSSFSVT